MAARPKQFKKNIAKHPPKSVQEQHKTLRKKASKIFASGKMMRWEVERC